jgi:orotate phosphoribosyltransferase
MKHPMDSGALRQQILETAMVNGSYVRPDGSKFDTYFDVFRLYADATLTQAIAMAIADQLTEPFDAVAGIALGGVPLATHLAAALGKPMLVVRPSAKSYGTYAQVEGLTRRGGCALLVDDVVRHATMMITAQKALAQVDVEVSEAACILTFGHVGYELLQNQGVKLHSVLARMEHK